MPQRATLGHDEQREEEDEAGFEDHQDPDHRRAEPDVSMGDVAANQDGHQAAGDAGPYVGADPEDAEQRVEEQAKPRRVDGAHDEIGGDHDPAQP